MNAFAYVDEDGQIDIDTVSSTKRAAMTNAVCRATYGNVILSDQADLIDVELAFVNATGGAGSILPVKVKIYGTN